MKELARRKPLRAVFRDNGYDSDSVKINVEQIFKLSAPTEVKSLRRMKLKFKHQAYQTEAVKAVVDCFAGQPKASGFNYRHRSRPCGCRAASRL